MGLDRARRIDEVGAETKRFDERDGYISAPVGAMTGGVIAAHAGQRRSSLPQRAETIHRVSIESC
jgi:hypothetical protein